MSLRIGDTAPDFTAESTHGVIRFHEWTAHGWAMLFSHPKDFTPVCTTELGSLAAIEPEFRSRDCKIIGLSVDSVEEHVRWERDIVEYQGQRVGFPLIGDSDLEVSKLYGMLPAADLGVAGDRTAPDNATVRTVFLIGPDKKIKLTVSYPMTTGRNFDELLRALDSIQLTARHQVATPAGWKHGDDVIIAPSVSNEAARSQFPNGWRTATPYMRFVRQPSADAGDS